VQRALDEAVAAVGRGDADAAMALAESPILQACFGRNRSVHARMLAVMIGSGNSKMLDYVRHALLRDPGLAEERSAYGRTLLHTAAGAGSLTTVALLLSISPTRRMGADTLPCIAWRMSAVSRAA